jgi:phosphoribosylamine--glycine ligase/phosphoribosylformylglycinamidine cyclo-ligase
MGALAHPSPVADDYDLAGFAVGAVERHHLLPTPDIAAGDVLLGLPSSGPHSNGFSLLRKVVDRAGLKYSSPAPWDANTTVGDALLVPTRIYIKQLLPAIRAGLLKGMSHITGGGFTENIPRVLPDTVGCVIDASTWQLPALWKWVLRAGNIAPEEMARTFNMGVGMVIVVDRTKVDEALRSIRENGEPGVFVIGELTGQKGVQIYGMERW